MHVCYSKIHNMAFPYLHFKFKNLLTNSCKGPMCQTFEFKQHDLKTWYLVPWTKKEMQNDGKILI